MVFEALVVEILNKFLGQYVQNLDTSQLKLGIWGGDVELHDLFLKENVLDDFNLPLRVSWGKLGKLVLKIPWKNLYAAPVIAIIQDLLLVCVPNNEMKYDPDKEEKWSQEKKQSKLKEVEEAKKREIEKDLPKPDDTFMEKLIAQIVKNVQITIKNIHVRYEDKTTNPGSPFCIGATMSNLSVQTISKDIVPCLKDDDPALAALVVYKMVKLEGLAVYWNPSSELLSNLPTNELVDILLANIPTADFKPEGYKYIIGPIVASASLRLNPKPESDGTDYSIPKVYVNVNMEQIALALTRKQFKDMMLLLQNLQRLATAAQYRKFRPHQLPVIGHAKEWWNFAYNAVTEDIRRRRLEWSWSHIHDHREMCREYSECFKTKLNSGKKIPQDVEKRLRDLERTLNVFNLVLLRERTYVEVERSHLDEAAKPSGWFSGWFSLGYQSKSESEKGDDLVKKLEKAMSPTEKEKLYKAIGYQENDVPTVYPITFVESQLRFSLKEIVVRIYDDKYDHAPLILSSSLHNTTAEFSQRPSGSAIKVVAALGDFVVLGMAKNCKDVPELVTSHRKESENLISVLYETKPLDDECDQRLHAKAHPLKIIYDAETINRIRDIFQSANTDSVSTIVAATAASLPTFQQITSMGLQYAIEKRSRLELKINVFSSHVIIPYEGIYEPNKEMIVIKLGELDVSTEESNLKRDISVRRMHLQGVDEKEIFSALSSASYTNFKCQLTGVQILVRLHDEDWEKALSEEKSKLRLLEPIDLTVVFKKSLVTDDARIPKVVIEGKLPNLTLNISEERCVTLAGLIYSIPTAVADAEPNLTTAFSSSAWSIQSFGNTLDNKLWNRGQNKKIEQENAEEFVQGIDLVGHFEMSELNVKVSKTVGDVTKEGTKLLKSKEAEEKFFELRVAKLEMQTTNKTFETNVEVKLGGIELKQNHKANQIPVVTTRGFKQDQYLFVVEFIGVDRRIPDFYSKRGAVLSRLILKMTPLDMVLHRDALLAQLAFATTLQGQLEAVQRSRTNVQENMGTKRMASICEDESKHSEKKVIAKGKKFRRKKDRVEVIDLLVEATLDEFDIRLELEERPLAELSVKGGRVELSSRKSYTKVDCKLRDVLVLDLNPHTSYKKIVTSVDEQTLSLQATIYNPEFYGSLKSVDLSLEAEIGRVRFVFLNWFLKTAVDFSSAFQSEVQMLKQASSVAAERAKQNMMKAYENATKLSLDVKITAPLVVFPMNSTSNEVLLIDMGVLTVKNNIAELEYTHENGQSSRPLIDNMQFHLQNLQFSRALLDQTTMKPVVENLLLDPVSFELVLKRNLSVGWFRELPDVEILARLKLIHVTLSHQDYSFVISASNENFSEGQDQPLPEPSRPPSQKGEILSAKTSAIVEQDESKEELQDKPPSVHTFVKFSFSMDSFIFDTISESDQRLSQRDKESRRNGLAKFVVETISLKGRMFSDGSLCTSVLLLNCLLEDIRPGKEGRLTRLMERKAEDSDTSESANVRSMMDITFQQKGDDTFVDVRVFRFYLILSMDFLSKLAAFFAVDETSSSSPPIQTQTKQTEKKRSNSNVKAVKASNSQKSQGKKTKEKKSDPDRPPTFTFNLRLERPDIIIVENMDSINTDALIFNTEMVLKYRTAGDRQVISGTLNDIGLFSCCFNPVKRQESMSQVLKPFTISLAGSTPEGEGLHLDVCLTEIFIVVNPKTIELLNKCYVTVVSDTTVDIKSTEEKDYSDLWEIKKFDDNDYWFLRTEEALDAFEALSNISPAPVQPRKILEELCLISISSIIVTVEGLSAKHTTPLLLLDMTFQGQARNWSHQLTVDSSLTVQMQYYNSSLAAWEPLIEPIEVSRDKKPVFAPWELNCNIVFASPASKDVTDSEYEDLHPPKMTMTLSCTEKLELTITKTLLEVLNNLSETFTSAVTVGTTAKSADFPPFVIKNETGLLIELNLEKSRLQVYGRNKEDYKTVRLETGGEVELQNKEGRLSYVNTSIVTAKRSHQQREDLFLHVKLPHFNAEIELPLTRTNKRYFPLSVANPGTGREVWGFVSDVCVLKNTNTVTLRSILQIKNHFEEPIDVHFMTVRDNEVEYVGTVEGRSSLNLPLYAVYNKTKELFFSVKGYFLSIRPLIWREIQNELNVSTQLQCNPRNPEDTDPFFITAIGEVEQIYYENTYRHTMASMCFNIHLQPTVELSNCLPVDLIVCSQGSAKEKILLSGEKFQIPHAEPGASSITLRIFDYLEKEWSCKESIPANFSSEFVVWSFTSYDGLVPVVLNVGVHCATKRSSIILTIYCPFLMVNKTGHLLSYKFDDGSTVIYHPASHKAPIMFSPSVKKFFSKKKASLKVNQGEWSDKFPIDVAGSGGSVECEDSVADKLYLISVTITLTFNSLTRIVMFTPYYVFLNKADFDVEAQECDFPNDPWIKIERGCCVPFWPRHHAKMKSIHLRPFGSSAVTPPFSYDSTDNCLLRLSNQYGGIFVDLQATNSGTFITFYSYEPGRAPALILNHSKHKLCLSEKGTKHSIILKPNEMFLHAWVKPQGERKMSWMGDKNKEYVVNLKEDVVGQMIVSTGEGEVIRYVSFLDGTQRILLFTQDRSIATGIGTAHPENSETEIILQIQGIGISMVNNLNQTEILYMGFVSSGIIWETGKSIGQRFKSVNAKDSYAIECAYRKYNDACETENGVDPVVVVDNRFQINFERMEMLHPQKRKIRRVFEPGLWAAFRTSEDQITLHAKINRIQVDSQLHDCIFPVILSPVPPPKTVAASEGLKPFFELSVLQLIAGQSRVRQYKYFKILIQEFNVKVDIGFLHHFWQFLTAEEVSDETNKRNFHKDIEYTQRPLISQISVISTHEQKNFYDLVHFSPLKMHFSFSLAGNIETNLLPPALSVTLQSLGVTLTDLHDVVFRLSYFERKGAFLTNSQLQNEVFSHYYGQAIRQAYVLLLGLDVIGNPYGLVIGIGRGVEAFFYEPVQGIIQGPSDFAAGVALGCKSLFGHTVGGTAGAISRITGTLGKGLTLLSLDKEYQRQRMEQQNRRTDNIPAAMAQGGKGVVMGVYEGVTGVVMKPISGAIEGGVGGFFKGFGKGMMGLVTKPVTGVVDFASTSLNVVKRATEQNSESKRIRPPRFFRDDKLVLPYRKREATGNSILYDIDKRKYCNTDKYEYHTELRGKEILLLTDKRMILAEYSEVFGTWQVHFTLTWAEMPSSPQPHQKGIVIPLSKKKGPSFGSSKDTKILIVDNTESRELLLKKMNELHEMELGGNV